VYNPVSGLAAGATAVGAGLALHGLNVTYAVCAAFALLAAGLAVIRIVPRLRRSH
jgi:hypothetical protein